jgi:4-hydroxybenzoate polyprenyltransferase
LTQLFLITIAAATARGAGMLFNRIIDLSIDKLNPRTKNRHLASGRLSLSSAIIYLVLTLFIYLYSAFLLGPVPLKLSWIPILMFVIYPYTKRYTWGCHFFLGLTHGLAPLAGWIAVNPKFDLPPFLLYLTSFFWVSGFDIYYATMDYQFDREHGVYSFPARFGINKAAVITPMLHFLTFSSVILFSISIKTTFVFKAIAFLAGVFLLRNDLSYQKHLGTAKINQYLQKNSFFSVLILLGALFDYVIGRLYT